MMYHHVKDSWVVHQGHYSGNLEVLHSSFAPPSSVCPVLTFGKPIKWGISLGFIAHTCVALDSSLPFSEFPIPYLGDEGFENNDSQGSTYLRNKMENKRP